MKSEHCMHRFWRACVWMFHDLPLTRVRLHQKHIASRNTHSAGVLTGVRLFGERRTPANTWFLTESAFNTWPVWHMRAKSGPCHTKAWPLSQNMAPVAHMRAKRGPCRMKTWPLSQQNVAPVAHDNKTWPLSHMTTKRGRCRPCRT